MRVPLLVLPLVVALALTGCGTGEGAASSDRVSVAAGFYPLEFLAREVGGPDVEVRALAKPGAEPHDLELTPSQVAQVADADLVVYLKGFQPAVDDAVEQQAGAASLDVATVAPLEPGFVPLEDGELHEDEAGEDPHVWLDPTRVAGLADAVAERLAEADPEGAQGYRDRAARLRERLRVLDEEFTRGLDSCAGKDLVTSHNAFGYLARAYGLQQIAITGLTPEDEPSPARLAEVTRLARERGVTTIFFEGLVSPKVAQSLAREIGARAEVLDPLETAPSAGDYFSGMRTNLASLRAALRCS